MKILILGASGLLGQHLFKGLKNYKNQVFGTIRNNKKKIFFSPSRYKDLIFLPNIFSRYQLNKIIREKKINVVINCISISKINNRSCDQLKKIFSDFPKQLCSICSTYKKIRLIQISTDGVFSGTRGNYSEYDVEDPNDFYGKAKLMGELKKPNQITLRLSMIGHDTINKKGLLEWFLIQKECKLYYNYLFSGLTTNEIVKVVRDYILKKNHLFGVFNLPGKPISKYDLLRLIAKKYNLNIKLIKDESIKINRVLIGQKFYKLFRYKAPSWERLIENLKSGKY